MPSSTGVDVDGLRQRNVPVQAKSEDEARQTVLQLNALEETSAANEQGRKTFGRTPNGTIFTVPTTHDMVSQLLSPVEPKNIGDGLVILMLIAHILAYWYSPDQYRTRILGTMFLFWRAGYNVGIGWLLQQQSNQNKLVLWATKTKLFGKAKDCPHPRLRSFVKRELEIKIPKDYNFDTTPIEYNTWLVFRRIVDLILMCDFTSYVLFALACGRKPVDESFLITALRWSVGIVLFAFNLWVKLDAHRVVKDFAWYWGDFFYLIDQELTFDGVFEMAPHPMYSIGYVGYYGISLMAASYKVLFVSILAHTTQFAFLVWVENPHIEKTYNSPPPKRQINELPRSTEERPEMSRKDTAQVWPNPASDQPSMTHNLLGFRNLDLYRTTDSSIIVISTLFLILTIVTPSTAAYQALFVTSAAICRLWFSLGIGYLLNRQSFKKKWTRHFVKYGESTGEAWRQWKGTYYLSMVLCYATFTAAAWKMYVFPEDWNYGLVLLKHVIGLLLVALQVWVSFSIYDSLGEFGWFYGDFFFDQSPKLTYGGIYRFLNNPERVLGLAGVWGVALITNSKAILGLALLSHTLSLACIQFVERPHMQKLYGRHLRQDAGLVRSLRRSLPPPLRQWQDGMDKFLDETFDAVEELLDAAKPKFAAGVNHFVQDTRSLLNRYPAKIIAPRLGQDAVARRQEGYTIEIEGESITQLDQSLASELDRDPDILMLNFGAPIKVKWTAPASHSKMDWIGLYMVADNASREVTRSSSAGRWIATNKGEYDTQWAEIGLLKPDSASSRLTSDGTTEACRSGQMVFSGDKLWWTQGSFEFRYHHDGKHSVMTISPPFKVSIPRYTEEDLEVTPPISGRPSSPNDGIIRQQIEQVLLPVVQNCFDRDYDYAPHTVFDTYGAHVERNGKFSRRVVYAILQMFGIEFSPEVVKADGKVENLAWRIWEAKKVLAPYSMSRSRGTSTPDEGKPKIN